MAEEGQKRRKTDETKLKIFEYISRKTDAVSQPKIIRHLEITGSSPHIQLIELENMGLIVNIAPEAEKQRRGTPNCWKLSSDAKSILAFMFKSFDIDPECLLRVFKNPGIQSQIATLIATINDDSAAEYRSKSDPRDDPYEDPYWVAEASLNEGMKVSPSFLRFTITGEYPPEYHRFEFELLRDFGMEGFMESYQDPHPLVRYCAFIMVDMEKYPVQMEELLQDVGRDKVAAFIQMAFATHPEPLEKFLHFGIYLKHRQERADQQS